MKYKSLFAPFMSSAILISITILSNNIVYANQSHNQYFPLITQLRNKLNPNLSSSNYYVNSYLTQQANESIRNKNNSKKIPGIVVFDSYAYAALPNKTRLGLPEKDEFGHNIIGRKDIIRLKNNKLFSLITFQDGWVRPAILQTGKKLRVNYLSKSYRMNQLIKVGERRYVLEAEHHPVEGGSDYYDIDLRSINNPTIKKISLTTAQRLGRTQNKR